jgi:hypothetical protein
LILDLFVNVDIELGRGLGFYAKAVTTSENNNMEKTNINVYKHDTKRFEIKQIESTNKKRGNSHKY